jgi:hypothetical protein
MEYLSLAAVVAVFLGTLYAMDRRDRREREERAQLLVRIQAPEVANFGADEMDERILGIEFDNDEEFTEMRQDAAS